MSPYARTDSLPSLSEQTHLSVILALVALTALGVFAVELFVRRRPTPPRHRLAQAALLLALGVYLAAYLWLTLLSRELKPDQPHSFILFESYRYAFEGGRIAHLSPARQILLNILLYLPPGLLVPSLLRLRGAARPWRTGLLAAAGLSLLTELTQLLTRRGMAEADDLFNNILGYLIGMGLYACLLLILNRLQPKKDGPPM